MPGYAKNIVPEFTIKVAIANDGAVTYNLTTDNNKLGLASTVDKVIKVKNVKNVTQLPLTGAAGHDPLHRRGATRGRCRRCRRAQVAPAHALIRAQSLKQ